MTRVNLDSQGMFLALILRMYRGRQRECCIYRKEFESLRRYGLGKQGPGYDIWMTKGKRS